MTYSNIVSGRFISRPNRFIAKVEINGREETVHVKNTGRCRELLVPGAKVYLSSADNPARKTHFDLVAVEKTCGELPMLVNMDSQLPNAAAEEWLGKSGLFSEKAKIRREVFFGSSRFDFCIEDGDRRAFLEVKGVTLERDGIALFPDAPTERGVRHLEELVDCISAGCEAYVLFVIQMSPVKQFSPNDGTHRDFGEALRRAEKAGVKILAMDCDVKPDSMTIFNPVPVRL